VDRMGCKFPRRWYIEFSAIFNKRHPSPIGWDSGLERENYLPMQLPVLSAVAGGRLGKLRFTYLGMVTPLEYRRSERLGLDNRRSDLPSNCESNEVVPTKSERVVYEFGITRLHATHALALVPEL